MLRLLQCSGCSSAQVARSISRCWSGSATRTCSPRRTPTSWRCERPADADRGPRVPHGAPIGPPVATHSSRGLRAATAQEGRGAVPYSLSLSMDIVAVCVCERSVSVKEACESGCFPPSANTCNTKLALQHSGVLVLLRAVLLHRCQRILSNAVMTCTALAARAGSTNGGSAATSTVLGRSLSSHNHLSLRRHRLRRRRVQPRRLRGLHACRRCQRCHCFRLSLHSHLAPCPTQPAFARLGSVGYKSTRVTVGRTQRLSLMRCVQASLLAAAFRTRRQTLS